MGACGILWNMSKKRISIVTLFGEYNYGNRLQNYALTKVLESKGHRVQSVIINDYSFVQATKIRIKYILYKLMGRPSMGDLVKAKTDKLSPFNKKYIKLIRKTMFNTGQLVSDTDCFVVGSDQVWNPHYVVNLPEFFLQFAPKEKRVSYAASFGVTEIPHDMKSTYKEYLNGMREISVREQAGVEVVKSVSGRDAKMVLDPTLLLSRTDWDELLEKEKYKAPKEKYVMVYVLGKKTKKTTEAIEKYAQENDCKIYYVLGDNPNEIGSAVVPTVPGFVGMIKGAEKVFTDSFHACVFSVIYDVDFEVVKREGVDTSSRITNLLKIRKDIPKLRKDSIAFLESAIDV